MRSPEILQSNENFHMVLRETVKTHRNRCDWKTLEAQEPSAAVEVPWVANYFRLKSIQNSYNVFALQCVIVLTPTTGLSKHLDYIAVPVDFFAVFL